MRKDFKVGERVKLTTEAGPWRPGSLASITAVGAEGVTIRFDDDGVRVRIDSCDLDLIEAVPDQEY
jgi:hypothetical protein